MKLFSMTDTVRQQSLAYIRERWTQLADSGRERDTEVIKYLLVVNAGSAVSVLAFIGATAATEQPPIPGAMGMLIAFVVGVILTGVLIVIRGFRIMWLFGKWRQDVSSFYADQLEWEELLARDASRSTLSMTTLVIGCLAFGCFVGGALFGLFSWLCKQ